MSACVAFAIWLAGAGATLAQFSSGSDGSDGPLNVTTNTTLDLPPDGIFRFTTINIASGATLKFNRNALNTPVHLLATEDVSVRGTIDVSGSGPEGVFGGKGGPGGFDGGFGGFSTFPQGDGHGPGGGKAIDQSGGVYADAQGLNNNTYGNILISPLIGGSGGAGYGSGGGGGGGGAILIASSSRITVNDRVRSAGGSGAIGGSSGAIRLVAPIVDGNGSLEAGGGRIRIDCVDRFGWGRLQLNGKWTRGNQMFVFPPGNPRLDIISAAGTAIPVGTDAPVTVSLPVGSSRIQTVRVQATGFTTDVPIRLTVTPENAPSIYYDSVILQSSGNPPFLDLDVLLQLDTLCHIHAWTR